MKRDTSCAIQQIRQKYEGIKIYLSEVAKRLWAATEAKAYGYGGILIVSKAIGMSKATIHKGLKELDAPQETMPKRMRKMGGGRKKLTEKTPNQGWEHTCRSRCPI